MVNGHKMHKITFTITPNANGYLVGCKEIQSLFTDVYSVSDIDETLKSLLSEYVENFPDDAQKKGFGKDTPIEITWHASPNSVALE
ncbi:MAG: hypothetical protein KGH76_02830 [Thaumarchaeota archaeon]|nr:hypothetical protein [Nitrososphaerota archaeon]MDE1842733.1 hypothetical protein [Nitrososphaerota archaeon]